MTEMDAKQIAQLVADRIAADPNVHMYVDVDMDLVDGSLSDVVEAVLAVVADQEREAAA